MDEHERARVTGNRVPPRTLVDVAGREVRIPDGQRPVHLQFRRFAGCPVCDLHLRSFERRMDEIAAAGVREVVVFHSSAAELRRYGAQSLPFAVIADVDKRLYAEFGVKSTRRALLDPRVWAAIIHAVVSYLWLVVRRRRVVPPDHPEGGRLGLPADFFIASDGAVTRCHYGVHAYDQWSVDELLAIAASGRASGPSDPDRSRSNV